MAPKVDCADCAFCAKNDLVTKVELSCIKSGVYSTGEHYFSYCCEFQPKEDKGE